jgi:hypothetical protein
MPIGDCRGREKANSGFEIVAEAVNMFVEALRMLLKAVTVNSDSVAFLLLLPLLLLMFLLLMASLLLLSPSIPVAAAFFSSVASGIAGDPARLPCLLL